MSHKLARQMIAKNTARLQKHFSGNTQDELDRETVKKLQYEIQQAEMHLEESEGDNWPPEESHEWATKNRS